MPLDMSVGRLLIEHIALPALRSLAVASVVGIAFAAFRVRSTSVRLLAWRLVLCAALLMPALSALPSALPIPIPHWYSSATTATASETPVAVRSVSTSTHANEVHERRFSPAVTSEIQASVSARPTKMSRSIAFPEWQLIAIGLYFLITSVLLVRLLLGLGLSHRLVRSSSEVHDDRVDSILVASGLTPIPRVAKSEHVSVPVTIGAPRSSILLPQNWQDWNDAKLEAVVIHELSHIRQRDPVIQVLALLHRAVFWFSPLAWWLNWALADLAEQTSDEAALNNGADHVEYARTLLTFVEELQATGARVWWQGVAMAKLGQTEKRVERILEWKGTSMTLRTSTAALMIAAAIPVVYVTASARPAPQAQTLPSIPATAGQLPPPAPAEVPTPPEPIVATVPAVASVQPAPAIVGVPPVPKTSYQQSTTTYSSHGYSFSYGYDDEMRFVIVSGKTDAITMSGSSEDAEHVQRLRKQIPGDFIWFQRDEKSYIIRDQATIDRARKLWEPQEELGKKQEALGKQQEALGEQQEALGKKMEAVRVNVPDMTAELDNLKAKLQKLGPTATMDQIGDLQSEIGDLESKIGDLQSAAGDQQSKLGDEQGKLGEQQGKLGEEQGRLGEQQAKLAREANIKMKALIDEAIKNGKAQPEPETGPSASL